MRILMVCLALATSACGSTTELPRDDGGATVDLRGVSSSTDLAQSQLPSTDLASAASTDLAAAPGSDLASNGLCCGQPGDTGNNLGVGQYCNGLGDCTGTANLCSTLGSAKLHFCTMLCTQGQTDCGTGATCQCNASNQCACFPSSCAGMPASCSM